MVSTYSFPVTTNQIMVHPGSSPGRPRPRPGSHAPRPWRPSTRRRSLRCAADGGNLKRRNGGRTWKKRPVLRLFMGSTGWWFEPL